MTVGLEVGSVNNNSNREGEGEEAGEWDEIKREDNTGRTPLLLRLSKGRGDGEGDERSLIG